MKIRSLTTYVFGLFLLVCSSAAIAQNTAQPVSMRTGVHEKYSRLVIDWPIKTNGEVTKKGNTLTIAFENNAEPDSANVDTSKTQNISVIKIDQNTPLTLTVETADKTSYRSFYAGNRFILDVYNPPDAKLQKVAQEEAPKEAKPESVKAKPTPELEKETKPLKEVIKGAEAAKVEPVEVIELDNNGHDKVSPPPLAKLENPGKASASLIALSSSDSFGLAVFERGDKIWIVNDKPDLLISPQITGPDSKYLVPLDSVTQDYAKIFSAPSLFGSFVRTNGGGLLWKVIIADMPSNAKSVEPERIGINEEQIHSGKVLFPFKEPGKIINLKDPVTGRILKIVTSKTSEDFVTPYRSFPEFDILPSAAGLVILPRVNDLDVKIKEAGIEISRPHGLALSAQRHLDTHENITRVQTGENNAQNPAAAIKRIFDFQNWQLGDIAATRENQSILLMNAHEMPDAERDDAFMTLAKMYLSHAMGAESLGFLYMIEDSNPEIANTPEFRAIRGAAYALDYKMEKAFHDLAIKDLEPFEEIGFWKAYALADIGDWQQAAEVMPQQATLLYEYPDLLVNRIGLVAAEVSLRSGNTKLANDILNILVENEKTLNAEQSAALKYLQGESFRQQKQIDKTKTYWEPLITGKDDLYRAKAGLALTRLLVDEKELTPAKAIDSLERLRYAWRGDELEARIGYWLGRTYFEAREFVKGLNIMREAATVAAGTSLGTRITNEMTDMFTALYLSDTLDGVSPLDAVALYEQFSELLPSSKEGDKIVERLADRLTQADLLGRAAKLLRYQLDHRLDGIEAYNVGVKLAAIYLLNSKPEDALKTLDIVQAKFDALPEDMKTPDKVQDMTLLRARALSRNGRPDQGIAMLESLNANSTTNRLRADIAWTAGYWDDAAQALGDVITDQNISLTRPLSDENTALIMQRAIALNLATDRIGLANMREKYSDSMAQTNKSRLFDVITRPRQNVALSDRETMMETVSEVDLFSDFLESYRASATPSN